MGCRSHHAPRPRTPARTNAGAQRGTTTMTNALHLPQREVRPSTKRYADGESVPAWDVYLDDRLVASEYVALADARMELDFAVWYALFGDATLHEPAPITDEALGLA